MLSIQSYGVFAPHPLANERLNHIDSLQNLITELSAHIQAANYQLLVLIRAFDECQGWSGPGMNSCAHWLNWKCGTSLGVAREKVRVAHALKNLPQISVAFGKGLVSYSKVRAMTRVATANNESVLLNVAKHGTARHVERQVQIYRKVKRNEALEKENHRHEHRELGWFVDDDGCWVMKGRFTAEQGALIQAALESAMDELFEEWKDVPEGTSAEKPGAEPIAQRRADAMVRLAEGGSRNHGANCCINVHTDKTVLQRHGQGAEAELEGHANIAAETTRRIACDASVVYWLNAKNREALDVGRKTRSIPPAIRRALSRRDGGCRFPGCSCTRFVDAHHIVHWVDGGETKMGNLVLLCRRHHRMVHEGGYGVDMTTEHEIIFTDTSGEILTTSGATRSRGNVLSLFNRNHQVGLHITSATLVPDWRGEKMDDDLAVLGLLQRE
jgi:hypothetical protein